MLLVRPAASRAASAPSSPPAARPPARASRLTPRPPPAAAATASAAGSSPAHDSGEQRNEHERQEPDDVEVEPVRRGELERDQHGRRRARPSGAGRRLARDERHQHGAARPPPPSIAVWSQPSSAWPQMLNGEGAARLVAERAVVQLAQPAVRHEREHRRRPAQARAPRRTRPARAGREQRGQRERRELGGGARGRPTRPAPARRARAVAGGVSASRAPTHASATSESLAFDSSANAV